LAKSDSWRHHAYPLFIVLVASQPLKFIPQNTRQWAEAPSAGRAVENKVRGRQQQPIFWFSAPVKPALVTKLSSNPLGARN
jgi:hypothetical protein